MTITLLAGDLLALWLATSATSRSTIVPHVDVSGTQTAVLFLFPMYAMLLFAIRGGYRYAIVSRPEDELAISIKTVTTAFVLFWLTAPVLFHIRVSSIRLAAAWYVSAVIFDVFARFGIRRFYQSLWSRAKARQKTIFIGDPARFSIYQRHLSLQHQLAFEPLGVLTTSTPTYGFSENAQSILGALEDLDIVVRRSDPKIAVVDGVSLGDGIEIKEIVTRCFESGLDVEVLSVLPTNPFRGISTTAIGGIRIEQLSGFTRSAHWFLKRTLDRVFGLVGTVVTVLLIPLVWILLKLEDGGPLFHRREYFGCDGRVHYYLKFRTMVVNADDILNNDANLKAEFAKNHKLPNDPRVLRIGHLLRRYSIDEFPQFFSLLTGKLTLVGPRVISMEEVKRYGDFIAKRMSFVPGITGYWQVMGRQKTTYEDRILLDMFYIEHWSFWLDLVIIGKTFSKVIAADGAF